MAHCFPLARTGCAGCATDRSPLGSEVLPKKRRPTRLPEMLLKEFLEPLGVTQKAFAAHLGWIYVRLNEVINGRRQVSADSELALAEALKTGPEFWLNLQRDGDLWHALSSRRKVPPLKKALRAFADIGACA